MGGAAPIPSGTDNAQIFAATNEESTAHVVKLLPLEWYHNKKKSKWGDVKKGKWVYIVKHPVSTSNFQNRIIELKSRGSSKFNRVKWSKERVREWKNKNKRPTKKFDSIQIGMGKNMPLFVFLSEIQLPYERVKQISNDIELLRKRGRDIQNILNKKLTKKNKIVRISGGKDSKKRIGKKIRLVDYVEDLRKINKTYNNNIKSRQQMAAKLKERSKEIQLAVLTRKIAWEYRREKNKHWRDLPLAIEDYYGEERWMLDNYLDRTITTQRLNKLFSEKSWYRKLWYLVEDKHEVRKKINKINEKIKNLKPVDSKIENTQKPSFILDFPDPKVKSPRCKLDLILKDYMYNIKYKGDRHDNYYGRGLEIASMALSGSIFTQGGREYLDQIMNKDTEVGEWYNDHFIDKNANPGEKFEGSHLSDFANIFFALTIAAVRSDKYSLTETQKFIYRLLDSITGVEKDIPDNEKHFFVIIERYLGKRGFPSQMPEGKYIEKIKEQLSDLPKLGIEALNEAFEESTDRASQVDSKSFRKTLNFKSYTHPLLIALVLTNISISVSEISKNDEPLDDLKTIGNVSSGAFEVVALGIGIFWQTTSSKNLALLFGLKAAIITSTLNIVQAITYAFEGYPGLAIGHSVLFITDLLFMYGMLPATSTMIPYIAIAIAVVATIILNWMKDDKYEKYLRKCPWGKEPEVFVSMDHRPADEADIAEQTRDLIHLVGKPQVSLIDMTYDEVQLKVEVPFIFNERTKLRIDPLKITYSKLVDPNKKPSEKLLEEKILRSGPLSVKTNIFTVNLSNNLNFRKPKWIYVYPVVKIKYLPEVYSTWQSVRTYDFDKLIRASTTL